MKEQVQYVEVRSLKKGEIIFCAGEPGDCAYMVERGTVGIYDRYGTPEQKLLRALGPGSVFGEMGMVRGFPRSADAVSEESNTGISRVGWDTLGRYFSESPSKVIDIMQQMAQRTQELSDGYIDACCAVSELLAQRDRLVEDNRRMERIINRLRQTQAANGPAEPDEVPVWRKLENESTGQESRRYKKYATAYSRYLKKQGGSDKK